MPRIATRHAHKLAYRRRFSLVVRMIGCLILLAGAIVLAAALAELVKGSLSRPLYLMTGCGVLLFTCGAVLFWGERGKSLDRQTRTLKCWWSVIIPLRRGFHDLQHYQAVGVQSRLDAGLSRWRVTLWNPQGERLDLFEAANAETAELAARQIGTFLSLAVAPPPASAATISTAGEQPTELAAPITTARDNRWTYPLGGRGGQSEK